MRKKRIRRAAAIFALHTLSLVEARRTDRCPLVRSSYGFGEEGVYPLPAWTSSKSQLVRQKVSGVNLAMLSGLVQDPTFFVNTEQMVVDITVQPDPFTENNIGDSFSEFATATLPLLSCECCYVCLFDFASKYQGRESSQEARNAYLTAKNKLWEKLKSADPRKMLRPLLKTLFGEQLDTRIQRIADSYRKFAKFWNAKAPVKRDWLNFGYEVFSHLFELLQHIAALFFDRSELTAPGQMPQFNIAIGEIVQTDRPIKLDINFRKLANMLLNPGNINNLFNNIGGGGTAFVQQQTEQEKNHQITHEMLFIPTGAWVKRVGKEDDADYKFTGACDRCHGGHKTSDCFFNQYDSEQTITVDSEGQLPTGNPNTFAKIDENNLSRHGVCDTSGDVSLQNLACFDRGEEMPLEELLKQEQEADPPTTQFLEVYTHKVEDHHKFVLVQRFQFQRYLDAQASATSGAGGALAASTGQTRKFVLKQWHDNCMSTGIGDYVVLELLKQASAYDSTRSISEGEVNAKVSKSEAAKSMHKVKELSSAYFSGIVDKTIAEALAKNLLPPRARYVLKRTADDLDLGLVQELQKDHELASMTYRRLRVMLSYLLRALTNLLFIVQEYTGSATLPANLAAGSTLELIGIAPGTFEKSLGLEQRTHKLEFGQLFTLAGDYKEGGDVPVRFACAAFDEVKVGSRYMTHLPKAAQDQLQLVEVVEKKTEPTDHVTVEFEVSSPSGVTLQQTTITKEQWNAAVYPDIFNLPAEWFRPHVAKAPTALSTDYTVTMWGKDFAAGLVALLRKKVPELFPDRVRFVWLQVALSAQNADFFSFKKISDLTFSDLEGMLHFALMVIRNLAFAAGELFDLAKKLPAKLPVGAKLEFIGAEPGTPTKQTIAGTEISIHHGDIFSVQKEFKGDAEKSKVFVQYDIASFTSVKTGDTYEMQIDGATKKVRVEADFRIQNLKKAAAVYLVNAVRLPTEVKKALTEALPPGAEIADHLQFALLDDVNGVPAADATVKVVVHLAGDVVELPVSFLRAAVTVVKADDSKEKEIIPEKEWESYQPRKSAEPFEMPGKMFRVHHFSPAADKTILEFFHGLVEEGASKFKTKALDEWVPAFIKSYIPVRARSVALNSWRQFYARVAKHGASGFTTKDEVQEMLSAIPQHFADLMFVMKTLFDQKSAPLPNPVNIGSVLELIVVGDNSHIDKLTKHKPAPYQHKPGPFKFGDRFIVKSEYTGGSSVTVTQDKFPECADNANFEGEIGDELTLVLPPDQQRQQAVVVGVDTKPTGEADTIHLRLEASNEVKEFTRTAVQKWKDAKPCLLSFHPECDANVAFTDLQIADGFDCTVLPAPGQPRQQRIVVGVDKIPVPQPPGQNAPVTYRRTAIDLRDSSGKTTKYDESQWNAVKPCPNVGKISPVNRDVLAEFKLDAADLREVSLTNPADPQPPAYDYKGIKDWAVDHTLTRAFPKPLQVAFEKFSENLVKQKNDMFKDAAIKEKPILQRVMALFSAVWEAAAFTFTESGFLFNYVLRQPRGVEHPSLVVGSKLQYICDKDQDGKDRDGCEASEFKFGDNLKVTQSLDDDPYVRVQKLDKNGAAINLFSNVLRSHVRFIAPPAPAAAAGQPAAGEAVKPAWTDRAGHPEFAAPLRRLRGAVDLASKTQGYLDVGEDFPRNVGTTEIISRIPKYMQLASTYASKGGHLATILPILQWMFSVASGTNTVAYGSLVQVMSGAPGLLPGSSWVVSRSPAENDWGSAEVSLLGGCSVCHAAHVYSEEACPFWGMDRIAMTEKPDVLVKRKFVVEEDIKVPWMARWLTISLNLGIPPEVSFQKVDGQTLPWIKEDVLKKQILFFKSAAAQAQAEEYSDQQNQQLATGASVAFVDEVAGHEYVFRPKWLKIESVNHVTRKFKARPGQADQVDVMDLDDLSGIRFFKSEEGIPPVQFTGHKSQKILPGAFISVSQEHWERIDAIIAPGHAAIDALVNSCKYGCFVLHEHMPPPTFRKRHIPPADCVPIVPGGVNRRIIDLAANQRAQDNHYSFSLEVAKEKTTFGEEQGEYLFFHAHSSCHMCGGSGKYTVIGQNGGEPCACDQTGRFDFYSIGNHFVEGDDSFYYYLARTPTGDFKRFVLNKDLIKASSSRLEDLLPDAWLLALHAKRKQTTIHVYRQDYSDVRFDSQPDLPYELMYIFPSFHPGGDRDPQIVVVEPSGWFWYRYGAPRALNDDSVKVGHHVSQSIPFVDAQTFEVVDKKTDAVNLRVCVQNGATTPKTGGDLAQQIWHVKTSLADVSNGAIVSKSQSFFTDESYKVIKHGRIPRLDPFVAADLQTREWFFFAPKQPMKAIPRRLSVADVKFDLLHPKAPPAQARQAPAKFRVASSGLPLVPASTTDLIKMLKENDIANIDSTRLGVTALAGFLAAAGTVGIPLPSYAMVCSTLVPVWIAGRAWKLQPLLAGELLKSVWTGGWTEKAKKVFNDVMDPSAIANAFSVHSCGLSPYLTYWFNYPTVVQVGAGVASVGLDMHRYQNQLNRLMEFFRDVKRQASCKLCGEKATQPNKPSCPCRKAFAKGGAWLQCPDCPDSSGISNNMRCLRCQGVGFIPCKSSKTHDPDDAGRCTICLERAHKKVTTCGVCRGEGSTVVQVQVRPGEVKEEVRPCTLCQEVGVTVIGEISLVIDKPADRNLGFHYDSDLTILQVTAGKPAAKAKMDQCIGYTILQVNGQSVTSEKQVEEMIRSADRLTFTLKSDGNIVVPIGKAVLPDGSQDPKDGRFGFSHGPEDRIINSVIPESPAGVAGLQKYDGYKCLKVNGKSVSNDDAFSKALVEVKTTDSDLTLTLTADGKVFIHLGTRRPVNEVPLPQQHLAAPGLPDPDPVQDSDGFGFKFNPTTLLLESVVDGSPAATQGLKQYIGFKIQKVNGNKVKDAFVYHDEYNKVIQEPGHNLILTLKAKSKVVLPQPGDGNFGFTIARDLTIETVDHVKHAHTGLKNQIGKIIHNVNGVEVTTKEAYDRIVKNKKPADPLTITFRKKTTMEKLYCAPGQVCRGIYSATAKAGHSIASYFNLAY